ncbi:class I SAM-dependent DNA methyltransferase [Candidatus Venteria ishoeyi]|uniref:site-specific DNA-methyltransferase (adenine-specific) n=1 Tax=Candidatus Venteria ishoeyi TaxID=1899563 RepID=A0A1H6FBF6_9GAMM|nr:N-6 DNA methylase [Candidatus Venteria ishoeyi]SEH06973.1 putative type I restriction enzymeP M protein [Candidatus Venteria ishoeyi]
MSNISGIVKSARNIMRQDTGTGSDELRILQLGWMMFLKIFSDKDEELEMMEDDYESPIPEELRWSAWAADDEGITGDKLREFVDEKLFPTLANIDLSTADPDATAGKRAILVHEVFANNYNYMKSGIHLRQVINKLNEIDFNNHKKLHLFGQIYETFLSELQSAGTLGEFYTPRAVTQFMTEMLNPQHDEIILDPACGTGGFLTAVIEYLKAEASTGTQHESIGTNVRGWEYKPLPYMLANTNLILHDITSPNIRYGDSLQHPLSEYTRKHRVDAIIANPPFGGVVSNNNENNFPKTYRTRESADLFLILMIHLLKEEGRAAIVLPDGSLTGDGVKQRIRQKLLEDCDLHTIVRLPNSVFQPYASVATNLLFFTKGKPTETIWYYEHKLPENYKAYSKTKPIRLAEFDGLKQWWGGQNRAGREESEHAWQVDIDAIKNNGYNLDIKNPHQPEEEQQHSSAELLDMLHQSFMQGDELLAQLRKELVS